MSNIESIYSKYNESGVSNIRGDFNKNDEVNLSLTKGEDGAGVPRLKFPADIESNAAKAFKSMTLYILKDVSYMELIKAATKAYDAAKGNDDNTKSLTGDESPSSISDIVEKFLDDAIVGLQTGSEYIKSKQNADTRTLKSSDFHCVITLPIPNNLTEDDTHSYEEGSWEQSLLKPMTEAASALSDNLSNIGQTAAQFGNDVNRRSYKQLAQVPILNPFTWKKFKGSQLKTFRFTMFFVPRSAEEAEQIMKIVYTLKKYSYGSQGTSTGNAIIDKMTDFLISAPPKFLIKFKNPMLQKLLNPGVCVLESIGTTYNEGNTVGMTADGIPRYIEINVALTEYNVRFQSDF